MLKIIFFDIDGNLFSHQSHTIPKSVFEAFDRLHEQGIMIFTATGRAYSELKGLEMDKLAFDGYVVSSGQCFFDSNFKMIFDNPIPSPDADRIVEMYKERKTPILVNTLDTVYLNLLDDKVDEIMKMTNSSEYVLDEYDGQAIYQMTYILPNITKEEALVGLPNCKIAMWNPMLIDVISKDCGKDKGIVKVLDYYGFSKEEAMVFGDSDNDIDMFNLIPLSVCMGNGYKEAKEAAYYVTDDIDNDGVIKALEHFEII